MAVSGILNVRCHQADPNEGVAPVLQAALADNYGVGVIVVEAARFLGGLQPPMPGKFRLQGREGIRQLCNGAGGAGAVVGLA